jgi:hypothetical protein
MVMNAYWPGAYEGAVVRALRLTSGYPSDSLARNKVGGSIL